MQYIRRGILIILALSLLLGGCFPEKKSTHPWVDIAKINEQIIKDGKPPVTAIEADAKKGEKSEKIRTISSAEGEKNPFLQGVEKSEKDLAAGKEGEGILLNFDNAEIYEVIQSIAEILNLNYIIDPQVKGVVNIRSGKKIPMNQLMTVFQKILHVNGLDIRSEGDYQYIYAAKQPIAHYIRGPEAISGLQDSPKLIMQIIPILHLSVAEARKLVEPYLSDHGVIYDMQSHNTLILVDFESKVVDCVTILSQLDVSPLSNLKINLVRIENAPLFELRDELDEILKAMRVNQADNTGVSIVPLERVNSLLLVGNNDALLQTVLKWISELDKTQSDGGDNIYIYNVRNCVASELAELVNSLIGEGGAGGAGGKGGATGTSKSQKKVSPKSSSSSSRSGSSSTTSRTSSRSGTGALERSPQQQQMGQQGGAGAPGGAGQQGVKSFAVGDASSAMQFTKEPLLISDDGRNVILIRAVPSDYGKILKVLERLDNVPSQVLIETLVAEVTLKDSLDLGVEWSLKNKAFKAGDSLSGGLQSVINALNVGSFDEKTGTSSSPNGGYLYSLITNNDKGRLFLNTLATQTDFSVLSSPHVLVLNNETATVNVGDEIPTISSETTSDVSSLNNSTNRAIQYRDTGILLNVTPRINYNGMITLEIEQEISNAIQTTVANIDSPSISKRQIKTKLAVKNGQSILIGGLIKKERNLTEKGIPYLKDVPVFGHLFKTNSDATNRTELMIMITPYVIESENVLDQYIKNFKDYVDSLRGELR